jgi:hypothetical protein
VITVTEEPVHEAYSFACLDCGHAWERTYEIRHRVDGEGKVHVTYYADGANVRSPLTHSVCEMCGGHHIRILRPGRAANAQSWAERIK